MSEVLGAQQPDAEAAGTTARSPDTPGEPWLVFTDSYQKLSLLQRVAAGFVHGILGDQDPDADRGAVFGVFNLIAELGAVASPVVSGVLRDSTGSWAPGVFTAAGIMAVSVPLYARCVNGYRVPPGRDGRGRGSVGRIRRPWYENHRDERH